MQRLARFIFFQLLKWKFNGSFPKVDKCVIIVIPHTSWHDFYIGVLVRKIVGLPMHFVAKDALFKPPFGWYFRWMGGHPVDRSKSNNFVEAVANIIGRAEILAALFGLLSCLLFSYHYHQKTRNLRPDTTIIECNSKPRYYDHGVITDCWEFIDASAGLIPIVLEERYLPSLGEEYSIKKLNDDWYLVGRNANGN